MDLEEAYDRVSREVLWQVLRIQNRNGKLLNIIFFTFFFITFLAFFFFITFTVEES